MMKKVFMMAMTAAAMLMTFTSCDKDTVKDTEWEGLYTQTYPFPMGNVKLVMEVDVEFDKTTGELTVDPDAYVNGVEMTSQLELHKTTMPFTYTYESGAGIMMVNTGYGEERVPFEVSGKSLTLTVPMTGSDFEDIEVSLLKQD